MNDLLTETVLFYWDCIDSSNQDSLVAGVGETKDWVDKLASAKFLHSELPSQCSSSPNSRHARTISDGGTSESLTQDPQATPVSTGTRASTPTNDIASESQECDPYIQGSHKSERQAMPNPSGKAVTRRTGVMRIAEVVSNSEPGEWVPIGIQSDAKKARAKGSIEGKDSKKRTQQTCDQASRQTGNEEVSWSGAPPSKRTKGLHSTSGSQRSGNGVNKKYVNNDLPPGATVDNAWRRLFISALAHFAGGYNNPWAIPFDKFTSVLQKIWNVVYKGKIEHTITNDGPVYHLARQGLNNWRSGFAAAAVAVITTFYANDADFADAAVRAEFAKAMLKKNRFLFSENRGTDNKAWSGLWRGIFVLHTFSHHFNFIQGRARVTILDKELAGPRTAFALACAAVSCMLTLVSNNNITFKSDLGNFGNVWTAVIPKGSTHEFNETVWGTSARRYLEPINSLTDENFALVLEETQKYLKQPLLAHNSAASGDQDSELDDLFAFR